MTGLPGFFGFLTSEQRKITKGTSNHQFTEDELDRIEWYRFADPHVKAEMIATYETIMQNVENESIKASCKRLVEAMRRNSLHLR